MHTVNGLLRKRPGWRELATLAQRPTALTSAYLGNDKYYFAVADGNLYVWGGSLPLLPAQAQVIATGLGKCRSLFTAETDLPVAAGHPDGLTTCVFACGGGKCVCFDGSTNGTQYRVARDMDEVGYAPLTSIARNPAGSQSTVLESINTMTRHRRNRFIGDGSATVFKVDSPINTAKPVTAKMTDGTALTVASVDGPGGRVTLATAPASGGATDNVEISFFAAGTAGESAKCENAAFFTIGNNDTRIVLSGHGQKPNYEWMSACNNPTYFPDDGYNIIGGGDSAIQGYINIEYKRNSSLTALSEIAADSNAYAPDLHLAVHTNANNGKIRGHHVYYYPASAEGKRLAKLFVTNHAELYKEEGAQNQAIGNSMYTELKRTKAVAVIEETVFHDNEEDAAWYHAHTEEVASYIADTVCQYFGIPPVRPVDWEARCHEAEEKNKILTAKLAAIKAITEEA